MRWIAGTVAALAASLLAGQVFAACETNPRFEWETAGGFTLFNRTDEGLKAGDALLAEIAATRTADGLSMEESYDQTIAALLKTQPSGFRLYEKTFYERSEERYLRSADGRVFIAPSDRAIRIKVPGAEGNCVWKVAGKADIPGVCAAAALVTVPAETETEIRVQLDTGEIIVGCIAVHDTLILAMGDSFAAGEGNPDRPTDWSKLALPAKAAGRGGKDWWRRADALPAEASADWWDNTCHRSLLSQHAQAALRLAAEDRQRTVTFVSFACSGATVLDGYIAPRTSAPGAERVPGGKENSKAFQRSQINQAVDLLCKEAPEEARYALLTLPTKVQYWKRLNRKTQLEAPDQTRDQTAIRVCSEWLDQADLVFNSLGGNDIGFAGVASWAVMPPAGHTPSLMFIPNFGMNIASNPGMGLVCPIAFPQLRCESFAGAVIPFVKIYAPTGEGLVSTDLAPLLQTGAKAFAESGLGTKSKARMHTLYPNILRDSAGELCGEEWTDPFDQAKQVEPWSAQYTRLPFLTFRTFTFGMANLDEDCLEDVPPMVDLRESCVMEKRVWAGLNRVVGEEAASAEWTPVLTEAVTKGHGVCAHDTGARPLEYMAEFGWPRWNGENWESMYPDPTAWTPYAARTGRWFRTANDSALTQYVVFKGGKGRSESVSGTIHPTAQAHAAMADAIVKTLGTLVHTGP